VPGVARPGGTRELLRQHPLAQPGGRCERNAEAAEDVAGVHQELDARAGGANATPKPLRTSPVCTRNSMHARPT